MNKKLLYRTWLVISLGLCCGCSTHRLLPKAITVKTLSDTYTTDVQTGQAQVQAIFQVPANYLAKRGRLIIQPQLIVHDSIQTTFTPLVLDAPIYMQKNQRRMRLKNYQDPYAAQATKMEYTSSVYELPFKTSVELPENVDTAKLEAVITIDGCVACSALDTLTMVQINRPKQPTWELAWMESEFVIQPKIMKKSGEAHLYFETSQYRIDKTLGDNQNEMDQLTHDLSVILQDTLAEMNRLAITGMASADGSQHYNLMLAHQRAEEARNWLVHSLDIDTSTKELFTINARPEGWQPVLRAMEADGHPDAHRVRDILNHWSDEDLQEKAIRALKSWQNIQSRYLSGNRKVAYSFSYTLRSFTTEQELQSLYRERPDAFNEEEWLRLASLMKTSEQKQDVYKTMLTYYPYSRVALNNLAVLCLRAGKETEARSWLCHLPEWCTRQEGKRLTWKK